MQIKIIYVNELNFNFANFDSFKLRQIIIIYIFVLHISEH